MKKKRPWLDCDNGELTNVLNKYGNVEVVVKTQLESDEYADEITNEIYDAIVVHVEHQNIRQVRSAIEILKKHQNKIVLYGYGVKFDEQLGSLEFAIGSNDVHQVVNCINKILGTTIEYPYGSMVGSDYSALNISSIYNYPIRYSKGCENACPFCERSLEKSKEYRSPEDFEEELRIAVSKYSAKAVTFLDASLLGGVGNRFVEDIVPILEKYHISWRANGVTLSSIDEKKVSLLKKSGCYLLSIGIESLAENVRTGKKINHSQLANTLSVLKQNEIYSLGFFICGLEGDTLEKSVRSFELVKELDMDIKLFSSAVALPGTVLWNYVNKNGKFLCDICDVFPDSKTIIHFETQEFTAEEREQFIRHTEILREQNHMAIDSIRAKIKCPWSISEKENIIWKT